MFNRRSLRYLGDGGGGESRTRVSAVRAQRITVILDASEPHVDNESTTSRVRARRSSTELMRHVRGSPRSRTENQQGKSLMLYAIELATR